MPKLNLKPRRHLMNENRGLEGQHYEVRIDYK